jgi:predicted transcriptional regulator
MFPERDVVRAVAEHGSAGLDLKVSKLISVQQLVCCVSTDSLEHIRLMDKNFVRHLPVIVDYSLIGVISIGDISTALGDEVAAAQSVTADVTTARMNQTVAIAARRCCVMNPTYPPNVYANSRSAGQCFC